MAKYMNRVEIDFSAANREEIQMARKLLSYENTNGWYQPQGFKSIDKEMTVVVSNNEDDLFHALKSGYWDHSCNISKVQEGSLIVIIPSNKLLKENPNLANVGIKGYAKGPMWKLSESEVDRKWAASSLVRG